MGLQPSSYDTIPSIFHELITSQSFVTFTILPRVYPSFLGIIIKPRLATNSTKRILITISRLPPPPLPPPNFSFSQREEEQRGERVLDELEEEEEEKKENQATFALLYSSRIK